MKILQKSVIMALVLSLVAAGATLVHAADTASLADAKGKPSYERLEIYDRLSFDPAYLYVGKVVSDSPLAVVTSFDEHNLRETAVISVWTGIFSRNEGRLQTMWDELTIRSDGRPVQSVPDLERYIEDFFAAGEQWDYYTEQYLGVMPWIADIPTDPEAAARNMRTIKDLTIYNMYNLEIEQPEGVEIPLGDTSSVTLRPQAPDIVNPIRLPSDVSASWAEDYMIHLWKENILTGYPDNTIRPGNTLTRSEFVALLTRALNLPAEGETDYSDAAGTWVEGAVAAAERAGIVPKGTSASRFRPNDDITRVEMIEMIYHAVAPYGLEPQQERMSFTDTSGLNVVQSEALEHTTRIGIIAGYPDGTFRPVNKLQRAEAFKVISVLLNMI